VLGRGALLLAAGAFDLALWVSGALLALLGLLSSIKATTERLTLSWLRRRKARRLRKQMAAAAQPQVAMAGVEGWIGRPAFDHRLACQPTEMTHAEFS